MGIAAQSHRLPELVCLRLVSVIRRADKSGFSVLGVVAIRPLNSLFGSSSLGITCLETYKYR